MPCTGQQRATDSKLTSVTVEAELYMLGSCSSRGRGVQTQLKALPPGGWVVVLHATRCCTTDERVKNKLGPKS